MERTELLSKIKKILEKQGAKRKLMQREKHDSVSRASSLINLTLPALDTMPSINEEAVIKQYSVQAVGRKRNTMMNAMQLDDAEFLNWVQDRLYRLAHENERAVADFTVRDLASGLQQWENLFSSQDKDWGTYRDAFMKYKDRFIKAASVILNSGQAAGSMNEPPSKAAPNNTQGSPATPTMLSHQAADSENQQPSGGAGGAGGAGGVAQEEQPQEYGPSEYLQYFQQLLMMDDASFADFVQDKILGGETAPTNMNIKKIKKMLQKDEKEVDKVFKKATKEIHKLYKEYSKRFLSTVEMMTGED
jgi:hypothetical protein